MTETTLWLPEEARKLLITSDRLLRERKWEEANNSFSKLISLVPERADFHFKKAEALHRCFLKTKSDGKPNCKFLFRAIHCYKKGLRYDPKNDKIYFEIASLTKILLEIRNEKQNSDIISNKDKRHYDSAISFMNKAIQFAGENRIKEYYNFKGVLLRKSGKYENAIIFHDKAIKIDEKYSPAHFNKGMALADLHRHREAIVCFERVIVLEISSKDDKLFKNSLRNKGLSLIQIEKNEEALSCFDEIIKLEKKECNPHFLKGILLAKRKDFENAINNLENGLDFTNDKEEKTLIYFVLGVLYEITKNNELSEQNFKNLNELYFLSEKAKSESKIAILLSFELLNEAALMINDKLDLTTESDFFKLIDNEHRYDTDLRELWAWQTILLKLLKVTEVDFGNMNWNNKYRTQVAHYTSADTLDALIGLEKGKLPHEPAPSPLRLSCVTSANDTTEGHIFQEFLCANEGIIKGEQKDTSLFVAQTSFSTRVNNLNQFRLYGKKENKEGTGVCLTFSQDFFRKESGPLNISNPNTSMFASTAPQNEIFPDGKEKTPLYWVLYYHRGENRFLITSSQIEFEIQFDESGHYTKPDHLDVIKINEKKNEQIGNALGKIKELYAKCEKAGKGNVAWHLLIFLRHLIKHKAFSDEAEMRVLKLCEFGKDGSVENGRLFWEYKSIITPKDPDPKKWEYYVKEIIAGPKVEDFADWSAKRKHALKKLCPDAEILISQSNAPLANSRE